MLAREQLGRRHERSLPPSLDRRQHRKQGDDRLAAADITLQQAKHALAARHVALDLAQRPLLRAGQRVGEGRDRRRFELTRAERWPAAASTVLLTDQRKRELMGE